MVWFEEADVLVHATGRSSTVMHPERSMVKTIIPNTFARGNEVPPIIHFVVIGEYSILL